MIVSYQASQLKEAQKSELAALVDACIEYEGLTLGHPSLEDEDAEVYFYYPTRKRSGALAVLIAYPNEEYAEVTAFTHPEYRCQGLFLSLFERFLSHHAQEELPVCFYPDGNSYDALAALTALECEYSSTEHMMSRSLRSLPVPASSAHCSLSVCDDISVLTAIHAPAFELPLEESEAFFEEAAQSGAVSWLFSYDDEPVGLCLGTADEDSVYLFGFSIHPDAQQKGIGTEALLLLLDCLSEVYKTVRIQVSEENTAAYRLYTKCGFTSTQELQEYWY